MNTKINLKPYFPPRITNLSKRIVVEGAKLIIGYQPIITRATVELQETFLLSPYAWKSNNSLGRLKPIQEDFRTIYARDYDRILHTRAIEALAGKTQVFTFPKSPHVHNRRFHSDKVSRVAQTISRYLGLNQDLTAAIALGHDLGHTPFGHEGEYALSDISEKILGLPFRHNLHSLRIVDILENKNLSAEVRNGIVCHCGEKLDLILTPGKIPNDLKNLDDNDFPYTLEGCVVRISDQIAYLAHDLKDALRLKIVYVEDLPKVVKEVLGTNPDRMIGIMIEDVIEASRGHNFITMSPRMLEAREALFKFEYEKVIKSNVVQAARARIPEIIRTLFAYYTRTRKHSPQTAIDKIASFTDQQAVERYNAINRLYPSLKGKI